MLGTFLLAGMTYVEGSESKSQQLAATSCGNGEEISLSIEQEPASAADALQQGKVTFWLVGSPHTSADPPPQVWQATTTFAGAIHPWPSWEASLLCDEVRSRLLLTLVFNRGVTAMTMDVFPIPLAADAEPRPPTREQPVSVAPDLTQSSLIHYEGNLPVDSGGVASVDSELRDDVLAVTIHVQSEYVIPLDLEIDLVTGEVREIDRVGMDEATEGILPAGSTTRSSAATASGTEDAKARQAGVQEVAHKLLKRLSTDRETLRDLSEDELLDTLEGLLAIRDLVTSSSLGYVNLLVADTLNRVLYVELARQIVDSGQVSPRLGALVSRFRSFKVPPERLVEMARQELERDLSLSQDGSTPLFFELVEAVSGNLKSGLADPLAQPRLLNSLHLLENPDLEKLLFRLWNTDHRAQVVLPLLVEYVRRVDAFTPEDNYEKIRSTLALSSAKLAHFGSEINPAKTTAAYDVHSVLKQVRDDSIDRFSLLGDLPFQSATTPETEPKEDKVRP